MTECLGIYIENNIIKYAKVTLNSAKEYELKEHGIRFIKLDADAVISDIIEETNSRNIPIVLNSNDNIYTNFQIIDNSSKKSYTRGILNTEFEAWCEKNAKSPEKYSFTYAIANSKDNINKYNGILEITEKSKIDKITNNHSYKVSGVYPANLLINNMVNDTEKNYVILNINKDIIVTSVIDGNNVEIKRIGTGIEGIIESFKEKLGSYPKAYEACRRINVYTDGVDLNDKELESIAEPILQDVIKSISTFVTKYKINIEKIFLTGQINLFRNLDVLLKEYFDLNCEILVPKIINSKTKDISEVVEITPAISIAYEYLNGNKSQNYLTKLSNINSFKSINFNSIKFDNLNLLKFAFSVLSIAFVVYIAFGVIYSNRVNKIVNDTNNATLEIDENILKVNEDIKYVSENKMQYQKINTQVDEALNILSNEKSPNGAYNVSIFLQNIIRIIPEGVKLNSISSDDNKNVKIVAESDSYANLGYFISELKLEGTLKNVTINDVKNGDITIVEIGGELP